MTKHESRDFKRRATCTGCHLDCPHAVLFVSPSEFCVMCDNATLMLRVQLCDVTSVTVNTGGCITVVVSGALHHSLQASAAAAVCNALYRRVAPVVAVSREVAVLELQTRWFSQLARRPGSIHFCDHGIRKYDWCSDDS